MPSDDAHGEDARRGDVQEDARRGDVQQVARRLRRAGCVYADDEARRLVEAAASPAELSALVERRAAGEPLEHVLGWAELGGLRFAVEPGVFVPRRRSELLVRRAAALARPGAVVVDLCCGSGAVGAAVAAAVAAAGGPVELHASDVDPAAVRCACRNLAAAGGRVYRGDLDEALPAALAGRVDVLVANVPYVPTGAIGLLPPEARDHEPRAALDGGPDGLDLVRRVATVAPRWLAPGGHVLVETSEDQARAAAGIMDRAGLAAAVVRDAELDATVVTGRRYGTAAAVRPASG